MPVSIACGKLAFLNGWNAVNAITNDCCASSLHDFTRVCMLFCTRVCTHVCWYVFFFLDRAYQLEHVDYVHSHARIAFHQNSKETRARSRDVQHPRCVVPVEPTNSGRKSKLIFSHTCGIRFLMMIFRFPQDDRCRNSHSLFPT